jgi:membrane-associated phospholipid phosphatase
MTEARGALWLGCSLVVVALLGTGTPALAQTEGAATPVVESTPAVETTAASPTAIAPSSPALSHLFKDTISDFRRLPSRDTLTWLSVGAAAAIVGHIEDANVTRSLSGSRNLDATFEAGSWIGGTPLQLGAAVATYTLGRVTNSSRATRVGADLIQAQALTEAMTFGVKFSVRRTRPDGSERSFPSGHASVSFASATVLQKHFGWKVGIPAYGVAAYVAASRIQTNRHYLSDVVFGAALGIVAGRTVTVGRGNARFAVAPTVTPGGGSVAFTWIGTR